MLQVMNLGLGVGGEMRAETGKGQIDYGLWHCASCVDGSDSPLLAEAFILHEVFGSSYVLGILNQDQVNAVVVKWVEHFNVVRIKSQPMHDIISIHK